MEELLDGLWDSQNGTATWYDRTLPEIREFMDRVAEASREHGLPSWKAVQDRIEQHWPGQAPAAPTIRDTIKRLLK